MYDDNVIISDLHKIVKIWVLFLIDVWLILMYEILDLYETLVESITYQFWKLLDDL